MAKFIRLSSALLGSVCVAACGGADRPAPAGDALGSDEWALEAAEMRQSEVDSTPLTERRRECEPGSFRDCRVYYTDESGQAQCPAALQLCREDGSAWLPCGEYFYDERGLPIDRDRNPPPPR